MRQSAPPAQSLFYGRPKAGCVRTPAYLSVPSRPGERSLYARKLRRQALPSAIERTRVLISHRANCLIEDMRQCDTVASEGSTETENTIRITFNAPNSGQILFGDDNRNYRGCSFVELAFNLTPSMYQPAARCSLNWLPHSHNGAPHHRRANTERFVSNERMINKLLLGMLAVRSA